MRTLGYSGFRVTPPLAPDTTPDPSSRTFLFLRSFLPTVSRRLPRPALAGHPFFTDPAVFVGAASGHPPFSRFGASHRAGGTEIPVAAAAAPPGLLKSGFAEPFAEPLLVPLTVCFFVPRVTLNALITS